MNRHDNRKAPRKSLHYPVVVEMGEGEAAQICMLSDASDTGARLTLQYPEAVPETFTMRLSRDGKITRKCHVVWRSEHQIGLEFRKEAPVVQPVFFKQSAAARG
jgi:hypothetical protein